MSDTRIADYQTAQANNVHLAPAIVSLRTNTGLGRLSDMEVFEFLQFATAHTFVITFGGNTVP